MGGLLDFITGGANTNAQQDLTQALANVQAVQTPTAAQLQLSPLAQYETAANLNPALMNAAQAGPSAFDMENLSQVPVSTMQQALAQEMGIANAQGMTPQEQAAIAQAEQSANEAVAGQRGAIAQNFAGMGVPQSLIAAALQNQTAGQTEEQMYQNAITAQANAANQGLTALSNAGSLAGTMNVQQQNQANTIAAAQNALNQFNTQNTQQAAALNQANQQAANVYNTTTAQNIANQNVAGEQQVQYQNQVEAPQEATQLALEKSGQQVGVGEAQAGQQTAAGQQQAGLIGGLIGAGGTILGGAAQGAALGSAIAAAEGGEIPDTRPKIAPTNFLQGGRVDGIARVPGNDKRNDTVPALLSPGEYVVPRTAMQNPGVRNFLAATVPTPRPPTNAHPNDVASILKALSILRGS